MPTGKPSDGTRSPEQRAEQDERQRAASTTSSSPATASSAVERRTAVRPYRDEQRAADRAGGRHGDDEDGEAERSHGLARAVPVDQREGEPVVRRALDEREAQHQHADEQGARLAPGLPDPQRGRARPRAARAPAGTRARRRRPRGAPSRPVAASCSCTSTPVAAAPAPSSAPATVPDAEAGVEARHERAGQSALDVRGLDVHRHVPGADAEAGEHQTGAGQRHGRPGQAARDEQQPDGDQAHAGQHRPRGAEPGDERAAGRQADDGADGQAQQEQAELAVAQAERLAHGGQPGDPAGEGHAVEGEDEGDGDPCALGRLLVGRAVHGRHCLHASGGVSRCDGARAAGSSRAGAGSALAGPRQPVPREEPP